MVLERSDAVLRNRELIEPQILKMQKMVPLEKYGISIDKNSVHGSDSLENAKIEIDFLKIKKFQYSFWIYFMFLN